MNFGKILFTQVMSFVPWKTFGRIIDLNNGNDGRNKTKQKVYNILFSLLFNFLVYIL